MTVTGLIALPAARLVMTVRSGAPPAGVVGGGHGGSLRPGGGVVVLALGLLHVLRADPWTGGDAGSRAGEAKKSGRRARDPAARLGLLRRALDAAAPAVTLAARREGARPLHGDAA
jgi:hypothetical protein